MFRLRHSVFLAALAGLILAAPAAADEAADAERLQVLESELEETAAARSELGEEAARIADELDLLRARMLASEEEIRSLEADLVEIAAALDALLGKKAIVEAEFSRQSDALGGVLAALQRIARQPAEMLIAMPTSPTDTHRTAMLLAAITPELDRRVAAVAETLASLTVLQDDIAYQEAQRRTALSAIREEQAEAAATAFRKSELLSILKADDEALAQRQDVLMREAADLNDLLAALREESEEVDEARNAAMSAAIEALAATSFSAQKGTLPLPVDGRIVIGFRQETADGSQSEGIALAARPGSRLVTPYDGQVVYAGPFSDYGHLLIIDHGEGYHTVLAGFARADVVLGQWLLAGEPVGVMATDVSDEQLLYVELRHDGEPINPLPWIAVRDNEVSGG
jgi:septal ring factor EnvC (AmiA/AmiB activator)